MDFSAIEDMVQWIVKDIKDPKAKSLLYELAEECLLKACIGIIMIDAKIDNREVENVFSEIQNLLNSEIAEETDSTLFVRVSELRDKTFDANMQDLNKFTIENYDAYKVFSSELDSKTLIGACIEALRREIL